MLGRRPCGSGAVAEAKQGMMTAEINQAHQLTSPLQGHPPQLLALGSRLSELAAYQMEQMIKSYSAVLSNRQPLVASPAGTSRLQLPLNTREMKPADDNCFPCELKIRDKSDLMKEPSDHNKSNDHKKRRKIEESISVVTSVPYDEQLWRKYGQKSIRGAQQPRSYFRCSYWKERGCQAKKTLQQDDKDKAKYHVVYTNPHTCSVAVQPHAFTDYRPIESLPAILNPKGGGKCFGSSFPGEHQICPPSADQTTPATMLSSEIAPAVLTSGTLEMTNNDAMFAVDDDYLKTILDELYMPEIYT